MGTHGNILTRPVHEVVNTFGCKSVGVISVSIGDKIAIPGCIRILVFQGVGKVRNPVLVGLSLAQPGLGVSITYEFTYIRDLAEPSRQLAQSQKSPSKKAKKKNEHNEGGGGEDKGDAENEQTKKDE